MAATETGKSCRALAALLLWGLRPLHAAVLPEDRADVLYHSYDGGGLQVNGPSVLVLKKIGEKFTVSGNYYVDNISSASIDVVTSASRYRERREEKSLALDYLHDKTTLSLAYGNSRENDYDANSLNLGVSTDLFGGMTTVTLGYGLGRDEVGRNGDAAFREDVRRQNYRLGLTQILTRDLLVSLIYEGITDQGYLNNPYRSVRYLNSDGGISQQAERYPGTRTSNAASIRARYYLPYRAALAASYRFFVDTWGIEAHTGEISYTHPLGKNWLIDLKYRYYTQGGADFYSDLFPYADAQNFLARDKELSSFRSQTLGLRLSHELPASWMSFLDRGSLNLALDYMRFDYRDFRDARQGASPPGQEPLYGFTARIVQLYLSLWY